MNVVIMALLMNVVIMALPCTINGESALVDDLFLYILNHTVSLSLISPHE